MNKKLTDCIECFDRFYDHHVSLQKENEGLVEQVSVLTATNDRQQKVIEQLQADLTSLQDMVTNVNQQVSEIDKLQARNKDLSEKHAASEEALKLEVKALEEKMEAEKEESQRKLTFMMESKDKEVTAERGRYRQLQAEKEQEISALREAMASARKEREDQMTVLSMGYESKLAKVQKQKSQLLQNTQPDQNVYRKKLQHMQTVHREEVAALQRQVTHLQDCLQARQVPSRQPPSRQTHSRKSADRAQHTAQPQ